MTLRSSLLLIPVVFVACNERQPGNVVAPDKLEEVCAALLEEGGRMRPMQFDSTRQAYTDSIFRSFGTTEGAFRSSLDTYKTNPELWKQFFEGVTKKLEQREKPLQKKEERGVTRTTPG